MIGKELFKLFNFEESVRGMYKNNQNQQGATDRVREGRS